MSAPKKAPRSNTKRIKETSGKSAVDSIFETAIEMVNFNIREINWSNEEEIRVRIAIPIRILAYTTCIGEFLPKIADFIVEETEREMGESNCEKMTMIINDMCAEARSKATEFMIGHQTDASVIVPGLNNYMNVDRAAHIIQFMANYKPCCRMTSIAWLIPDIDFSPAIVRMIAHAAESFADFINQPNTHAECNCTPVGNSWLHRLGIFLLHHCQEKNLPPPPNLVRLMSLVSLAPSASVKSGKATRMYDGLAHPNHRTYHHEAPECVAVGNQLALELLGELDANRQDEYFGRLERAVHRYAMGLMFEGAAPSSRTIQEASGLSWGDSKKLVTIPSFSRLAFLAQCRYIKARKIVENCPDCQRLARQLDKGATPTRRIPSSV